jgi:hypothetical protein
LFATGTIQEADFWPLATISGTFNDMRDFYNNVANVDIATFHTYGPHVDNRQPPVTSGVAQQIKYFRDLAAGLNKAFWIGEAGIFPEGWAGNNLHNYPMSTLLAASYLGVQLTSAWTFESKEFRCWAAPTVTIRSSNCSASTPAKTTTTSRRWRKCRTGSAGTSGSSGRRWSGTSTTTAAPTSERVRTAVRSRFR